MGYFDKKISLHHNDTKVGCLYYKKILSYAVIYSLYIHPTHRNHGLAGQLLAHACTNLKAQGVSKIFIQPGPYEFIDGQFTQIKSPAKIDGLVRLYARAGFVSSTAYRKWVASWYYYVAGIDENTDLLMES